MGDDKYGRLYPERAVSPLRDIVRRLLRDNGTRLRPEIVGDCNEALADLDQLGFPPDEPLFLLRGQDKCAPPAVRFYIGRVADCLASIARQHDHLMDLADRMEAWQPRKLPD